MKECRLEKLSDIEIIYVEDDEVDRHIFQMVFGKIAINSNITFIENGEAFLDFLHRRNSYVDRGLLQGKIIIFLDINLPGISGLDVLKELRRSIHISRNSPSPPVVMFSASKRDMDISDSKRWGATDYFVKPFSYQEMHASLNFLLLKYLQNDLLKDTSL